MGGLWRLPPLSEFGDREVIGGEGGECLGLNFFVIPPVFCEDVVLLGLGASDPPRIILYSVFGENILNKSDINTLTSSISVVPIFGLGTTAAVLGDSNSGVDASR